MPDPGVAPANGARGPPYLRAACMLGSGSTVRDRSEGAPCRRQDATGASGEVSPPAAALPFGAAVRALGVPSASPRRVAAAARPRAVRGALATRDPTLTRPRRATTSSVAPGIRALASSPRAAASALHRVLARPFPRGERPVPAGRTRRVTARTASLVRPRSAAAPTVPLP